jgi:hypothetical protein
MTPAMPDTPAPWTVEYSEVFGKWWATLTRDEQESVAASVGLLRERGPQVPAPFTEPLKSTRHQNLRLLRVQHEGRRLRVVYAVHADGVVLLVCGDRAPERRWNEIHLPTAELFYDDHLRIRDLEGGA